nr:immunoglobulin heavy chain junction region [Macaca mulatta]MOV58933.1 immunoglobulin heavy chain junction region [Macaca mulatta]
CVIMMISYW